MSSPTDNLAGAGTPTGKSKLLRVVEDLGLGMDRFIGKRLTNLEKQIDNITRKAKGFAGGGAGGSSGSSGSIGLGSVSSPGANAGNRIGLGSISQPPVQNPGMPVGSQAGGSGMGGAVLRGVGAVVAGGAALGYGMLPDVMDAVGQNLTAQSVASMNGMGVRQVIRGTNAMLKGGMTSNYSAQEAAAAVLYSGGYLYGGQSAGNILRSTGGFSIMTGLSNARVAGAAAGVNGMNMLRLGISPRDSQGNLRAPEDMAAQLYRRTYGGRKISAETAAAVFNPGSVAYANTMAAAGGNQDLFMMLANYQVQMARNGGKAINMKDTEGVFKQMGIEEGSPYRKNFRYQGSEANKLEATGDSLVAGYGAALDSVSALNDKFSELANGPLQAVIEKMGNLAGFLGTLPQLGNTGSTLAGLGGGIASSLGGMFQNFLAYRGVSKGIEAFRAARGLPASAAAQAANGGSKVSGAAASILGKLAPVAGKALPILSKVAPVLGRLLPGVGAAYTLFDTHMAGRANRAEGGFDWGNLVESTIAGAVAGGFTGGPWGALAGAILNPINYSVGYAMGAGGPDDTGASAANAFYEGRGAGNGYRTPQQAAQWAADQARRGTSGWQGLCERFARSSYGLPGKYPSAKAHWQDAVRTGRAHRGSNPPVGALVYWTGGRYGHAAVSVGGGRVASTDIKRRGKVDIVPISYINRHWSNMTYEGWADPPHTKIKGGGTPINYSEPNMIDQAKNAISDTWNRITKVFGYDSNSETSASASSAPTGSNVVSLSGMSTSMSGFTSTAAVTVNELLGASSGAPGLGGPGDSSPSSGGRYHVTMNVSIARASNDEAARLARMVKRFIESDAELDRIGKY